MNLHATQLHESEPKARPGDPVPPNATPAGPPGRFAYASGARPLQGYTIKRGIGHGGFGEVYYATSDAGKEVALKLIRRNLDIELRGVTQCLNLKHPNLLSLFDVRQDDKGDNWVVMELMSGESLEDVLNRYPNGLPLEEVLSWIHGIGAGVMYLHDHGIVHRDLKPGNIFVDEGMVKIGDYGLSKFISCSRRSGQTGSVGTVHYMAPEIANGRYGKEIDIYALGIILYEMLTGHVPFEGESVGEILMKHLTAEPDVSKVAEPYRTIVSRALAKDPVKRFTSVDQLIAMLPPAPTSAAVRFAGPNPNAATAIYSPADAAGFDLSPPLDVAGRSSNLPPPPPRGNNPDASQAGPAFGAGNAADKSARANPSNEEPVVRWARETWNDSKNWWERKNFKPWQKIAILILGLWVAISVLGALDVGLAHSRINIGHIIIIGVIVWVIYNGHERRRAAEKARESSPSSPNPKPPYPNAAANAPNWKGAAAVGNSPVVAPPRPVSAESPTRRRWRSQNYLTYQPGPPKERITQLVGSMLISAVACFVLALVMMILRGESVEPNLYAWLAVSSVLGSWAVLIPAKLWEGQRGDAVLRRFVMLVIGLAFGACSFGLANWLFIELRSDRQFGSMGDFRRFGSDFFSPSGSPQILAYLAFFGFLFVIIRWWRQADPLRSTRLSIWHTGVTVFFSWLVAAFWSFPLPWGLMLAATIAISVQLAAPWLTPAERAQLPRPTGGG